MLSVFMCAILILDIYYQKILDAVCMHIRKHTPIDVDSRLKEFVTVHGVYFSRIRPKSQTKL